MNISLRTIESAIPLRCLDIMACGGLLLSNYQEDFLEFFEPDVDFVMVHMGLGTDNKEAVELIGKLPNLYGDTTWVPVETTLEVIKRYGSKKLMFGSDMPIDGVDTYACNPKGERSLYQDYFHVLPEKISKEAYEDLMWRNAAEVFGIWEK